MTNTEQPTVEFEQPFWDRGILVAGVDEAGRGPLAGPVVAAAVVFPPGMFLEGVRDSKRLSANQRELLYPRILENALAVAVGSVDEMEIDRINILQATYRAMRSALEDLKVKPGHLLIDGGSLPGVSTSQTAICGGDRLCFSIAAASIVAKVTRDRIMVELDRLFPEYGFARHKGYGTRNHVKAIERFGRCRIHRNTFHIKGWREEES